MLEDSVGLRPGLPSVTGAEPPPRSRLTPKKIREKQAEIREEFDIPPAKGRAKKPRRARGFVPERMKTTTPTHMESRRSQNTAVIEQSKSFQAYFCQNLQCNRGILPTYAESDKRDKVKGFLSTDDGIEIIGTIDGKPAILGVEVNLDFAKRRAEVFAEHFKQNPIQRSGELIAVHQADPASGETKLLKPGELQPEMIAARVCPRCYSHYELISRTADRGAERVKSTPDSRRQAKAQKKLAREQAKMLKTALKKPKHERTAAESKLVTHHQAVEHIRARAVEEDEAREVRRLTRKDKEKAWLAKQEKAALEKTRHTYRARLIQGGMSPSDAAKKAAKMTPKQAREFQGKKARADERARKVKVGELEQELSGKRLVPFVTSGDIKTHQYRRQHGLEGGEGHGLFEESLNPAGAKMKEAIRGERLRERQINMEEAAAKKSKKKVKKSLWIAVRRSS